MASKAASKPLEPTAPNTLLYTILIPAYNEEHHIPGTVEAMAGALRAEGIPFELLIVNDNSRDHTRETVHALQSDYPELRLVDNPPPGGFGRAVRCGLDHFEGDVLALVMADMSDSPEDVVRCYRKIEEGYDCVFGSRFIPGARVTHYPPLKLFVNRLVSILIRVLFATRHNDLTNAFKVYRREVIEGIAPLRASHFNLTIEMSLSALIRGYRIATVPIAWSGRTWGQSNLKLKEMGRRYLCTLLMIWFERMLVHDDVIAEAGRKNA